LSPIHLPAHKLLRWHLGQALRCRYLSSPPLGSSRHFHRISYPRVYHIDSYTSFEDIFVILQFSFCWYQPLWRLFWYLHGAILQTPICASGDAVTGTSMSSGRDQVPVVNVMRRLGVHGSLHLLFDWCSRSSFWWVLYHCTGARCIDFRATRLAIILRQARIHTLGGLHKFAIPDFDSITHANLLTRSANHQRYHQQFRQ
jgi:hypothetical protein